jgi:hypothetical protein
LQSTISVAWRALDDYEQAVDAYKQYIATKPVASCEGQRHIMDEAAAAVGRHLAPTRSEYQNRNRPQFEHSKLSTRTKSF